MKTFICPVDFSVNSQDAAMYASQLANELKARIILLHVYESPIIFTEASLAVSAEIIESLQADVVKRLNVLRTKLEANAPNARFETRVVEGFTVQEIGKLASKEDADIVVMGATGKGKAERLVFGSTSAKVISESKCPVLLIPKNIKYSGINKIVFATDLHEDNLTAAAQIVPFAKHFNAEIVFVFVDDKNLLHPEEYISNMSKKIRAHVNYNRISGYVSENTSVTEGIEFFMKKHPSDLLIMFKHTWQFPKSIVNQSITRKMSNLTKIPLLSLPVESQILADL